MRSGLLLDPSQEHCVGDSYLLGVPCDLLVTPLLLRGGGLLNCSEWGEPASLGLRSVADQFEGSKTYVKPSIHWLCLKLCHVYVPDCSCSPFGQKDFTLGERGRYMNAQAFSFYMESPSFAHRS